RAAGVGPPRRIRLLRAGPARGAQRQRAQGGDRKEIRGVQGFLEGHGGSEGSGDEGPGWDKRPRLASAPRHGATRNGSQPRGPDWTDGDGMVATPRPDLRAFPNSPYAAALQRGANRAFDARVEAEYVRTHLANNRTLVRVTSVFAALLAALRGTEQT